jgi:cysteine desulfurase/selenocysteine lyase
MFNLNEIRKDFPILSRTVNGKPLVYFDNGATAQKPQVVIDAISHYYSFQNSNIHAYKHLVGEYPTSSSFALWQGIKLFENKELPQAKIIQRNNKDASLILIYNHYLLEEHTLFLLRK